MSAFTDSLTQNQFVVAQAPGLPQGQQGLFFVASPRFGQQIPKNQLLCNYANDLECFDTEEAAKRARYADYSVQVSSACFVAPTTIQPKQDNLGLFCNCALKRDPLRQTTNAKLSCSFDHDSNGAKRPRIRIKSTKTIYSGQEVLISYGPSYVRYLNQKLSSE